MKIVPCQQNSLEWLVLRSGIPTASEFDNLLTAKFEIRKGQMPLTYLALKTTESWLGGPVPGFQSMDMEIGQILEGEAKPRYTWETNEEIQTVGLVTTDDGKVGCSPDGLIGEDGGIEIKCPLPQTHVKYLLAGKVPDDYLCQVHGAMFVTGRKWWKFMSYHRRFPPLILTVERDEEIQEAIGEALTGFLGQLERSLAYLVEKNGGVRPAVQKLMPLPERTPDYDPNFIDVNV